jgi:hypothetical protein
MTRKEGFEQRHGDSISRLKLVLIVVCLVAIGASYVQDRVEDRDVARRITRVETPCLKYGSDSKQCRESFEAALLSLTHAQACAIQRKSGVLKAIRKLRPDETGSSFNEPCLGARLAQEEKRANERRHTKEAAGQPPQGPTGTQPSGPKDGGGEDVGAGKGGEGSPSAPGKGGSGTAPAPGEGGSDGGSEPPSDGTGADQRRESAPPPANEATIPPAAPPPSAPPPVAKADVQVGAPGANLPDLDVCVQAVAGVCVKTR